MMLRRRAALGMRKARTQGAGVAALRTRLRTMHGAAQCCTVAEVSFFDSLPGSSRNVGGGRRSGPELGPGGYGSRRVAQRCVDPLGGRGVEESETASVIIKA
jgi:hypothetical protein